MRRVRNQVRKIATKNRRRKAIRTQLRVTDPRQRKLTNPRVKITKEEGSQIPAPKRISRGLATPIQKKRREKLQPQQSQLMMLGLK